MEKLISGIKVTSGIILGIISGVYSKCALKGGRGREEGKEERGEKRKITFSWQKTPEIWQIKGAFPGLEQRGMSRGRTEASERGPKLQLEHPEIQP